MRPLLAAVASLAFLCSSLTFAQTVAPPATSGATPAWMVALGERHQMLVERNGPGTETALRGHLLVLAQLDQQVRAPLLTNPEGFAKDAALDKMSAEDRALTSELKVIVAEHGWPDIRLVGYEASNAAMAILIHSEDHDWQRSLIPMLSKLVTEDRIDGSAVATLIDKELVSEGKAQLYGTQFQTQGNKMMMFAVSDPAGLGARRTKASLMPIEAYKQILSDAYHVPVGDLVIAPAK